MLFFSPIRYLLKPLLNLEVISGVLNMKDREFGKPTILDGNIIAILKKNYFLHYDLPII